MDEIEKTKGSFGFPLFGYNDTLPCFSPRVRIFAIGKVSQELKNIIGHFFE